MPEFFEVCVGVEAYYAYGRKLTYSLSFTYIKNSILFVDKTLTSVKKYYHSLSISSLVSKKVYNITSMSDQSMATYIQFLSDILHRLSLHPHFWGKQLSVLLLLWLLASCHISLQIHRAISMTLVLFQITSRAQSRRTSNLSFIAYKYD